MPHGVTYNYYLGPWVWRNDDDMPGWYPPAGTVGCVDLRGLVDCGLTTHGDCPYGFFAVDGTLGSDYALLGAGDLRDLHTTAAMQDAWQALLGQRPEGDKLVDLLAWQLTTGSDPEYDGPTPPLMPCVDGSLPIHLAGHSVVWRQRFRFGRHSHTDKVRLALRHQFRRIAGSLRAEEARLRGQAQAELRRPPQARNNARAEALGKQADRLKGHERRVLDYWCDKYRLDKGDRKAWEQLVPADMRQEIDGLLPHETVITDDFNRANQSGLGTSAEGWSWSQAGHSNTPAIDSDRAYVPGNVTDAGARADIDLSSDDHYAQANVVAWDVTTRVPAPSVLTRHINTDGRTYYMWRYYYGATAYQCHKRVGGTFTLLGDSSPASPSPMFSIRGEIDGSSFGGLANGSSVLSLTDSSIVGYLRCGIRINQQFTAVDDFEAGDLHIVEPTFNPALLRRTRLIGAGTL